MTDFQEIRKLFEIWDNSFGVSEEEIFNCEQYLGKTLPETLRQYYLQLGNSKEINQIQDNLVLPGDLEVYDDGFVIIYYENQAVWEAGIKFSDFEQDNPDVYLSYDHENRGFEIGTLHNFLIAEAFLQSLFALPFNANALNIGNEKEIFIRQNWTKSEFKSYLWGTEFFQNSPGEILAVMKNKDQADVFVAAKNAEKFHDIDEKLKIDWNYNSLEN